MYGQPMEIMEEAGAEGDREHPKSRSSLPGRPCRTKSLLVSLADAHKNVEMLIHESIDKLVGRMIKIAE